jgi:hypothetical protein
MLNCRRRAEGDVRKVIAQKYGPGDQVGAFFGSSPRVASFPCPQDSRRDVVRSVKLINVNAREFAFNCYVKYLHCSIFCSRTFRQIDDERVNLFRIDRHL